MFKHVPKFIYGGLQPQEANQAIIAIHGRGGDAEGMLQFVLGSLTNEYFVLAPQATPHTWYPQRFLVSRAANEPAISSALEVLGKAVEEVASKGIAKKDIVPVAFSQGACLMLDYLARIDGGFRGAIALHGALPGSDEETTADKYSQNLEGLPLYMASGDIDEHIPLNRFLSSIDIMEGLGARVIARLEKNTGHTITMREVMEARAFLCNLTTYREESQW